MTSEYNGFKSNTQEQTKSDNEKTRSDHSDKVQSLNNEYNSNSSAARNEHKSNVEKLKEEADKKYEQELAKINKEALFQKETKAKKGSGGRLYKYKNHPEAKQ